MKNTISNNGVNNPFYAVRIGSVIRGATGLFQTSVIAEHIEKKVKKGITKMIADKDVQLSMKGASSYVYNDSLNQGFAGVSGSYGLSGLARINSGLSAHIGNSIAQLTKEVKINYNVQMISGIEHINFDELKVEDLINSLKSGPRDRAMNSLENYNKIMAKIGTADLLTILKDAAPDSEIVKLVKEWISSVQRFFNEYGDGIVVGVAWGGIGTVSLTMNNKSTENSWKYGSKGNFTYAGLTKAITIEAAYDGSNTNRESDVSVKTDTWYIGDCVAAQVAKWSEQVKDKAFSAISSINLLEKAPKLGDIKPPPAVPDFATRKKDPKVTDKINEITDLSGLEAFAKAAAYEKAKETEPNLTLDAFLKRSRDDVNAENVMALQDGIAINDLDVLAVDIEPMASVEKNEQLETSAVEIAEAANSNFTVLGVWIANWSDLFPWMAIGYLNQIDNIKSTLEIIKKQCMIQDFLALAKTYFMLEASGISSEKFQITDFKQLAIVFGKQAGEIRDRFDEPNIIQTAYGDLSFEAQEIYTKWNDIKFLRSAELGLGVLYKGKDSITDKIDKIDHVDGFTKVWYKMGKCSFLPRNYSAFSSFLKVVPFVTPAGDIYAFGPSQMILNQINNEGAIFSKNSLTALKLEVDKAKRVLKSGDIVFYPIPFEAAKNLLDSSWKGQSISTNVASIKNIDSHIANTIKAMKDLKVYSFSSSNWYPKWKPSESYSIKSIKSQYIGLVDEIRTVFGR
ncbi:hypothetical protein J2Y38_002185 [Flavobacterium sp. 2755]|uniref:hypothetical protein n=1 Tax=Flavobacterium sp. 2755 TaxID=2817765 RepID=UPI0028592AE2|nr:hypothetical protein [Flavobacterium sp. 2755]MDR6761974.1 hypothetical protein [Flavobacterium sp. 2755]